MREPKETFERDLQESAPGVPLSLSKVGVTNMERLIRLRRKTASAHGSERFFFAKMDLFVHLDASQKGAHMSRFAQSIEELVDEVSSQLAPDAETLAERLAREIARAHGTFRAEVRLRARYAQRKTTPVSNRPTENLYTFLGMACSDGTHARRCVGVEVQGMTVCPCAQSMVSEMAEGRLAKMGYGAEESRAILAALPLASHNQRGTATLVLGTRHPIAAEQLVEIAQGAMSAEIYEMLKRPDELCVVERAHEHPRFVEDVVREMISGTFMAFPALGDDTFVLARQENFESIHFHNAFAEKSGLLGEVRAELDGSAKTNPIAREVSLDEWLGSPFGEA